MLALLPDGCACRRCGRLGSGSSVGAKRWRWRFALILGLHSVLSDAVGVALLPRLVGNLESWHRGKNYRSIACMYSFFSKKSSEPFSHRVSLYTANGRK